MGFCVGSRSLEKVGWCCLRGVSMAYVSPVAPVLVCELEDCAAVHSSLLNAQAPHCPFKCSPNTARKVVWSSRNGMDPVSFAASIAGIATLAESVVSKSYRYLRAVVNCEEDVRKLLLECDVLCGLLSVWRSVRTSFRDLTIVEVSEPTLEGLFGLKLQSNACCSRIRI